VADRTALLRAVAANHRAWFRRCAAARNGVIERVDGIELAAEPPWGTLAFPGARGRSRKRLDELMARARARGLDRMSCWSLDADRVLGALLIARGFEWGWEPHWMALDLDRIPGDDAGHDVVPFKRAPDDRELPYRTLTDPAHARHLSVRVGGETVGHVIVNPWRGFAGIYNMGVVPSHRRRGVGRALTLAACRLGRELGCSYAVLNATPEGELLYRTVGFESIGMGQTWWLHPGRRPTARQTALVEAIGLGGVEALAALRPTRAELERPIPGPGPPLVVVANTRTAAVADWILARRPELVHQRLDPRGATLLHFAVEGDDEPLLRVALAHGGDPSVRDRAYNATPLGWANHAGRANLAALLS
jgi:ribosomal protein S18 acetylase RimI-like enzyme